MPIDLSRLTIVYYPAAVLRQPAEPIASVDDAVRAVAARMIELMYEAEGVGLAAPQVGLSHRMFVTRANEEHPDRVYINPVLSDLRGELGVQEEGCLSLPGVNGEVRRPIRATITALDVEGREFTLSSDALLARIWQHETDHLDGVLIIDRMSRLGRLSVRKAVRELEDAAADAR